MISILWAEPSVIEYPEMFTVDPSELVLLETKRYDHPAIAFSGAISGDLLTHLKDMAANGDMLKEFADLDRRMKAARSAAAYSPDPVEFMRRGAVSLRCLLGIHRFIGTSCERCRTMVRPKGSL